MNQYKPVRVITFKISLKHSLNCVNISKLYYLTWLARRCHYLKRSHGMIDSPAQLADEWIFSENNNKELKGNNWSDWNKTKTKKQRTILEDIKGEQCISPVLPSAYMLLHRSLCCGYLEIFIAYFQMIIVIFPIYSAIWIICMKYLFRKILQKLPWAKCPPHQTASRLPDHQNWKLVKLRRIFFIFLFCIYIWIHKRSNKSRNA